jgi:hypothetical protein
MFSHIPDKENDQWEKNENLPIEENTEISWEKSKSSISEIPHSQKESPFKNMNTMFWKGRLGNNCNNRQRPGRAASRGR